MFGFSEITRPQKRHFLQPESGCLQAAATVRPQKQRPCRLPGDLVLTHPSRKEALMKYHYPRAGMNVQLSADALDLLREQARDLGTTMQNVLLAAALEQIDPSQTCPDWQILPTCLK